MSDVRASGAALTATYIIRKNTPARLVVLRNAVAQIEKLPSTRDWRIDICEHKDTRSGNQNRYLHGVVYKTIADFTGCDPDEVHEFLAHKFLSLGESNGIPRRQSTAKLNTSEFEGYCERCRAWAATELGVVVPLPNEEA